MKKFIICIGLAGLITLLYCLFDNIIDGNFGWNSIPKEVYTKEFKGIQDSTFQSQISTAESLIKEIQKKSSAPSISIAAMIKGEMVWSYAVGMQSIENLVPADTSTQYRIGSVSKAVTSLGLGKLIDEDMIHLDSSIQYYTNVFDERPRITIRQLASHQSGIRNYGMCFCFPVWEYYRDKEFESIHESVLEFSNDPLLFQPGSDFSYSSFNYTALSLAVERIVKNDFPDFMNTEVFQQLGMNLTEPDFENYTSKSRATPYDVDRGIYKHSYPVNLSNKWAGGGLISTPSDLVKAGNVLLNSIFMSAETIQKLTTPQKLLDGTINEQNYALGWRHDFSEKYFDGEKQVEVIHHGGMAVGGLALLVVYPEYNLVIAMTMNKSGNQGRFELFDYIRPISELFMKAIDG